MNKNKEQLLIDYCRQNGIDLSKLYAARHIPRLGHFHFTNGTYSDVLIKGQTVDGVYVCNGYCLSRHEGEKMDRFDAINFCKKHNVKLPNEAVRDMMADRRPELNAALNKIGWPTLYGGGFRYFCRYWSTSDDASSEGMDVDVPGIEPLHAHLESYTYKYRVRGVFYSGDHTGSPSESEIASLVNNPHDTLKKISKLLKINDEKAESITGQAFVVPQAGYFLLDNNTASTFKNIGNHKVKGIFLDQNLYVDLDMNSEEVRLEDLTPGQFALPKYETLELLEKVIPQVDYALSELKLDHLRFYNRVPQKCWHETLPGKRFPGEKRRLVQIKNRKSLSEAEKKLLDLSKILL